MIREYKLFILIVHTMEKIHDKYLHVYATADRYQTVLLCSSSPHPCIWFILRLIFHRIVIDTRHNVYRHVYTDPLTRLITRGGRSTVQQRMKRSERGSRPGESGQPHHVSFRSSLINYPGLRIRSLEAFDRARKILRIGEEIVEIYDVKKKKREREKKRIGEDIYLLPLFYSRFDTFLCFCAMFDLASFFFITRQVARLIHFLESSGFVKRLNPVRRA